jgi:hypothetical protein
MIFVGHERSAVVPLCGKGRGEARPGRLGSKDEENEAGGTSTRGRMQDRRVGSGANCQLETEKEAASLLVQSNQTFSTRPPAHRGLKRKRPKCLQQTKNDPYIT